MATFDGVVTLANAYLSSGSSTLPEGGYDRATHWAWAQLLDLTSRRILDGRVDDEDIVYCFVDLCRYYIQMDAADGKQITSESVGDWTRNYSGSGYGGASSVGEAAYSIAAQWLGGTGLLYRGIC